MARILVVDDIPLVGRMIRKMFRRANHLVDWTDTGHQAIALHGNLHFDLAIIDINLGDSTGPVLAVRLQEEWPVRVLLMSAMTTPAGWDGELLLKPFDRAALLRVVESKLAEQCPPIRRPRPDRT